MKRGRRGILTAIDQAVVVLLVRLAPVPAAREPHPGDALAASLCVVVEVDFLARSNGLVEELLYPPSISTHFHHHGIEERLTLI